MANTSGIRAGKVFVEIGAVSDKLVAGLKSAQKRLAAFGSQVRSVGLGVTGAGLAAITPLLAAAKVFSDSGDVLDKASIRTGISVEALSELKHAAELSGTNLETLENGIRTMQRTLGEAAKGSGSATDALNQLGLTAADLEGLSPEEQFELLADRVARIEDPTLRAAAAMKVFGKSGTSLIPLIEGGASGINALQEEARRLGLTVSGETAKDAADLNDALGSMSAVVKKVVFAIGSALAPTLSRVINVMATIGSTVIRWIEANKPLILSIFKVVAVVVAVGSAILGAGVAIAGIGAVLGGLAAIVPFVTAAIGVAISVFAAITSPIGLAITAVVALGAIILKVTGAGQVALDWLGERFQELGAAFTKIMGGISDALATGDIALAAKVLWTGLVVIWKQGVHAIMAILYNLRASVLTFFQSLWYGMQAAVEIAVDIISNAFTDSISFISKTWTRFTATFQKIWSSASAFVAKRMLEIQGLFDKGLDVDAAKADVDRQLESKLADIENHSREALAEKERRRQERRSEAAAKHDAALARIGQDFLDAKSLNESVADESIARSQADLDAAKKALDDAVATARAGKEAADEAMAANLAARRRPTGGPAEVIDDQMDGLRDRVDRGVNAVGTFNASAASGLGTGNSALERTAAATEQTAKNTKRTLDAIIQTSSRFE